MKLEPRSWTIAVVAGNLLQAPKESSAFFISNLSANTFAGGQNLNLLPLQCSFAKRNQLEGWQKIRGDTVLNRSIHP